MDLNRETLERWVDFVAERHRVHIRRSVHHQKPPWTEDPILREHRFTNVYRELDPGTTFARDRILNAEEPEEEKLFNLMIYRLVGREETWERVGWLRPWSYTPEMFVEPLRAIIAEGRPPWSNAYLVNSYHWTGYNKKEEGVAHVIGLMAERWYETWPAVLNASSREAAHRILHAQVGWGGFLAYQALVDASYPRPDPIRDWPDHSRALLPQMLGNDGYAFAGPGAISGLKHLYGSGATQSRANELAVELQNELNAGLERRGMAWEVNELDEPVPLSRANVMNCLCEFHKYERIREGRKGPLKYFKAVESYKRDLEARGHGYQYDIERDALASEEES